MTFDWNDYVQRVLSPALDAFKRENGALPGPFVRYDVPESARDAGEVEARVAAVRACWQKNRQHPKYGMLITALIKDDARAGTLLLDPAARGRALAEEHAHLAKRFEPLDEMLRVVEAQRGYLRPADVDALVASLGGQFTTADVRARTRAPVVDTLEQLTARRLDAQRYEQIKGHLAVLGQPDAYAFLGVTPNAPPDQVRAAANAAAARWHAARADERKSAAERLLQHAGAVADGDAAAGVPSSYDAARFHEVAPKIRGAVSLLRGAAEKRITAAEQRQVERLAMSGGLPAPHAARLVSAVLGDFDIAVTPEPARPVVPEPQPVPGTVADPHRELTPNGHGQPDPRPVVPLPPRGTPQYYVRRLTRWLGDLFEESPKQFFLAVGAPLFGAVIVFNVLAALLGAAVGWVFQAALGWTLLWATYQANLIVRWRLALRRATSAEALDEYVRREGEQLPAYHDDLAALGRFVEESGVLPAALRGALVASGGLALLPTVWTAAQAHVLPAFGVLFWNLAGLGLGALLFVKRSLRRIDPVPSLARAVRRRHEEITRGPRTFRLPGGTARARGVAVALGVAALGVGGTGWAYASWAAPQLALTNAFRDSVDGVLPTGDAHRLAPGASLTVPGGGAGAVRWSLVRRVGSDGVPLGAAVAGSVPLGDRGRVARTLVPIGGGLAFVQIGISNNTPGPLRITVNPTAFDPATGAPLAHCDCRVRPGAYRYPIGYYDLARNSAVQATDGAGRRATFSGLARNVDTREPVLRLAFSPADFH